MENVFSCPCVKDNNGNIFLDLEDKGPSEQKLKYNSRNYDSDDDNGDDE